MVITPESLGRFLTFLEIEKKSQEKLIKNVFQFKNFKLLSNFLFLLIEGMKGNFTLTNLLKDLFINGNLYLDLKDVDKISNNLMENDRELLSRFSPWDLLDSFEIAKIKGSVIQQSLFCSELLGKSPQQSSSLLFNTFLLFEKFLH